MSIRGWVSRGQTTVGGKEYNVFMPEEKPMIDWTKPVISRDGRVPNILSMDGPRKHTAVVGYFADDNILRAWNSEGACQPLETGAGSLANDLINKPVEPVVRWVSIWRATDGKERAFVAETETGAKADWEHYWTTMPQEGGQEIRFWPVACVKVDVPSVEPGFESTVNGPRTEQQGGSPAYYDAGIAPVVRYLNVYDRGEGFVPGPVLCHTEDHARDLASRGMDHWAATARVEFVVKGAVPRPSGSGYNLPSVKQIEAIERVLERTLGGPKTTAMEIWKALQAVG